MAMPVNFGVQYEFSGSFLIISQCNSLKKILQWVIGYFFKMWSVVLSEIRIYQKDVILRSDQAVHHHIISLNLAKEDLHLLHLFGFSRVFYFIYLHNVEQFCNSTIYLWCYAKIYIVPMLKYIWYLPVFISRSCIS